MYDKNFKRDVTIGVMIVILAIGAAVFTLQKVVHDGWQEIAAAEKADA